MSFTTEHIFPFSCIYIWFITFYMLELIFYRTLFGNAKTYSVAFYHLPFFITKENDFDKI